MFFPSTPIISETVSAAAVSVLLPALAAFLFLFLRKKAGKRRLRLLLLISLALLPAAAESVRAQELTCGENDWQDVTFWFELPPSSGCIRLMSDINAGDEDSFLNIDNTVTLDLNGHTIDRGLKDSDPIEDGCVIWVSDDGSLTLTGNGTITGGNTTGHGGGIINEGTLTIAAGSDISIIGNTADESGGGGVCRRRYLQYGRRNHLRQHRSLLRRRRL